MRGRCERSRRAAFPPRRASRIVAYRTSDRLLELPADKFEEYLREEGFERISALRAKRGESAKPSRELFSRCAKALVAAGAGSTGDRALGLTLELLPEKNPALSPGEALPIRLLYEGKPLSGALVVAVPTRTPAKVSARTDAKGNVACRFPRTGSGSSRPCMRSRRRRSPAPTGRAFGLR